MKKRLISSILAVTMISTSLSISLAHASEIDNLGTENNSQIVVDINEDVQIDNDTPVLYVDDIPIFKDDVNDDGTLKPEKNQLVDDKLKEKENNFSQNNSPRMKASQHVSQYSMMKIAPSNKGKTIFLKAKTTAVSFAQNEEYVYLPNKAIPKFKNSLSKGVSSLTAAIISAIPKVGPYLGIILEIDAYKKKSNISKLNSYYKNKQNACYSVLKSPYATLTSVRAWDGVTIKGKNYKKADRSQYSYKVLTLRYGKKV